jgi:hypothetical protein
VNFTEYRFKRKYRRVMDDPFNQQPKVLGKQWHLRGAFARTMVMVPFYIPRVVRIKV